MQQDKDVQSLWLMCHSRDDKKRELKSELCSRLRGRYWKRNKDWASLILQFVCFLENKIYIQLWCIFWRWNFLDICHAESFAGVPMRTFITVWKRDHLWAPFHQAVHFSSSCYGTHFVAYPSTKSGIGSQITDPCHPTFCYPSVGVPDFLPIWPQKVETETLQFTDWLKESSLPSGNEEQHITLPCLNLCLTLWR